MNTAVKTASTPPITTDSTVSTMLVTIMGSTPYSSAEGFHTLEKTNLKKPIS